jgi:hypothetical protein
LIFSDVEPPDHLPENITFVPFSLNEFCELASEKLSFPVSLSPHFLYKLCDFKPAYGLIYEEYLNEYDFWGHCDVDIVWGQIRSFVNDEILDNYEIITSRPKRISGHFCLYKNYKIINKIFLSMPQTVSKLNVGDKYQGIDEEDLTMYLLWLHNPTILSKIKQFIFGKPYVPTIYWEKVLTTSGFMQRELYGQEDKYFLWRNGRVYNGDTEMMYLHFHVLKNDMLYIDFSCDDNPREFIINQTGIRMNFS